MNSGERRRQFSGRGGERIPTVYVDGSCKNNGRDGAKAGCGVFWGPNNPLNVSERVSGRQTNQTAELRAAHKAIEQAKSLNMDKLIIETDSKFVIQGNFSTENDNSFQIARYCYFNRLGVTKWMDNWKQNGWKTASGRDVVNRSDFEKIDQASRGMDIQWKYVPGHQGIKGNEEADRLATEGSRK